MTVIIDAGHGINTPGKCSPDQKFKEWKYCRELADRLADQLIKQGYTIANIMHGKDEDESLRLRCARVNLITQKYKNCILISLHNNAASIDQNWHNASGWSVFVSLNASNNSKLLAQCLCNEAIKQQVMGNRNIPDCKYWQQNLAICRDTKCPAVLVENMFMDNKQDLAFLESEEGKNKLIKVIIDGIQNYKILKNLD